MMQNPPQPRPQAARKATEDAGVVKGADAVISSLGEGDGGPHPICAQRDGGSGAYAVQRSGPEFARNSASHEIR